MHTLVNLMPNGKYLMEDFCYAGGLPVVIRELGEHGLLEQGGAHRQRQDDLGEQRGRRELQPATSSCRSRSRSRSAGIAVLRGNLCPDGAIIKPSAATPKLMKHKGRAVVFENIEDFHAAHRRPEARHRRELA